jgi:tRNA(Ile)-lysidine synthase
VRDPTNDDCRFARNRVRHELLPLANVLSGRDLVPVLARQATLLRDEADFLDTLAASLDPTDATAVRDAPRPLARRAMRRWLRDGADHPPDADAVERVLAVAGGVRVATEVVPGRRVRRSRGRLSAVPVTPGASGSVTAP